MIKFIRPILKWMAEKIVDKYDPQIVAVTGSVGKTSAKDAIFSVLSSRGGLTLSEKETWVVGKSRGNFNNEVGLPINIIGNWKEEDLKLISLAQPAKTKRIQKAFFWIKILFSGLSKIIFKIKKYPEILVLEFGADKPGDIKYLLKMVRPMVGVVTAIGDMPSHSEFYEDAEAVAREKGKLVESLPVSGYAILNHDDPLVLKMKEKTRAKVLTYGFSEKADIKISQFENLSQGNLPLGIYFRIEYENSFIPVNLRNVFGKAQAYAVAAAFAVGIAYELNIVEISDLIEKYYVPAKRRMNLLEGIKNTWIIDDSYNAAPLSMNEALMTLKDLNANRKIAVLGDMLELGQFTIEAHEKMGKVAAGVVDILVTVGSRAKLIAESAKANGMKEESVISFDSADEARIPVQNLIKEGDLILIKASRGIGLDKVVDEVKKI